MGDGLRQKRQKLGIFRVRKSVFEPKLNLIFLEISVTNYDEPAMSQTFLIHNINIYFVEVYFCINVL